MRFGLWPFVASAVCVGILMPLAIRARSIGRDCGGGVQTIHVAPTSRLGGAVIVIVFLLMVGLAPAMDSPSLRAGVPLAVVALPVVLMGLAEDITCRVRPRYRLLAAVVSAALASAYAGGVVPRVDLPLLDNALSAQPWIMLALTWFMVAGACNAVNLIDGAHGLAAGTSLIMFGGIALAAGWSGDALTLAPTLAVMGALAGFLVWNYPRGRIFLGDAGAYFLGFMYAELSIQLVARNSGISAWYVIMLAGYPIIDTLCAIYRRAIVRRTPLMAPDGMHLHTLVFRRVAIPIEHRVGERRQDHRGRAGSVSGAPALIERRRAERRRREVNLDRANARVAPRLWLHGALGFILAVLFNDNTPALWGGLLAYAVLYVFWYRSLLRFEHEPRPEMAAQQRADLAKPLR